MTLSENMAKNKNFILTYVKYFGDRNSLRLCLFTESVGTGILVSSFGNDVSTSTTFTQELEAAEVQLFAKIDC